MSQNKRGRGGGRGSALTRQPNDLHKVNEILDTVNATAKKNLYITNEIIQTYSTIARDTLKITKLVQDLHTNAQQLDIIQRDVILPLLLQPISPPLSPRAPQAEQQKQDEKPKPKRQRKAKPVVETKRDLFTTESDSEDNDKPLGHSLNTKNKKPKKQEEPEPPKTPPTMDRYPFDPPFPAFNCKASDTQTHQATTSAKTANKRVTKKKEEKPLEAVLEEQLEEDEEMEKEDLTDSD